MFLQLNFFNSLFGRRKKVPLKKGKLKLVKRSIADKPNTQGQVSSLQSEYELEILIRIWQKVRNNYFPNRPDLDTYRIKWSTRRQKRTLASCNIKRRVVSVAREMSGKESRQYLEPLIYHEMCHAVLGRSVSSDGQRSIWHGAEFRALEQQHPMIQALEFWIKEGGWQRAVRSHRSREYHQAKKLGLIKDLKGR